MKRSPTQFLEEGLRARREQGRLRQLHPLRPGTDAATVRSEGETLVNFSSNDYLGLSRDPLLKERSAAFTQQWGAGSPSSRLVTGNYPIHEALEERLAEFTGREAALLFISGYQANCTLIPALTTRHSLILADKMCHNSILQGALLSRGRMQRFDHNSADHLRELLQRGGEHDRVLIVTESVFSMDGDRAPLGEIAALAREFDALLYIDDAHAAGVWGERGKGLAAGVDADIVVATGGKAFGASGAWAGCSRRMREYLVNECAGFIYSTAPPPSVVGALDAAVERVPQMEAEREQLHRLAVRLREGIRRAGFDTGASDSQIIPVMAGGERAVLELSSALRREGLLATPIRPPTVPRDGSRLRITLTADHTGEQADRLLQVLGAV